MTNQKITVHEKIFDIAWGDMDALGHVNKSIPLPERIRGFFAH